MSLMGGDNDTQQSFIGDLLQNLESVKLYFKENFPLIG